MIAPYILLSLLLPLVMLAGLIWLVVWSTRRARARARARFAQVQSVGWYPVPPNPWLCQVAANLFKKGKPGEMYVGQYNGRGLCVLDYTYVTSNGKSTQTHRINLVALTLPVALPPITVMRDNGLRRMLGGRDLELENQQFNERFRVECLDDRYGSAVMHPRMMECVLRNPGLEWQIAGNAFVSWGRDAFAVPDVFARLDAMTRLVDLLPPFVLRDYGSPGLLLSPFTVGYGVR
ncbi:MAG TPA: hypothetical protein VGL05_07650 [Kribbella sp.]